MLQDVLTRLGPVPTRNVQDPPPTHSAHHSPAPSIPTSSAGRKKVSLKPSFPPEFSGDRASGKAFLTQGARLNTLHKVGKYYVKNSTNYNYNTLSQNMIRELKSRFSYFF